MTRPRFIVAAMLAVSIGGGVSAQAATLVEELRSLAEEHPRIRSNRELVGAASEGEKRAFAGYLPTVSMHGDTGWEATDSPFRRDTAGESFRHSRKRDTVSVTQNVFDGFRTQSANASARLQRESAEIQLESVRQQVLLEGVAAYLDVLKQRRLVDLAQRNEANIQTQLRLEDERVSRGSGIAVDVLLAKSRLQLAKERRVAFEGGLRDAASRYRQVYDRSPEIAGMSDPTFPAGALPGNIEDARRIGASEHPDLATSQRNIDIAGERKTSAAGGYYPRLDVVGRANYEDDVDGVPGIRRDGRVVLQATWELFSGFGTKAEVSQAEYQRSSTLANHAFVSRKVIEEVDLAWQAFETAREREGLLRNAVNIATEVFESRKRLRAAGKDTALNVLDAENEVYNAEINLVGASYEALLAQYRVLRAVGRLSIDGITPR
jgi:outer membrane protein, adhesin transport system